MAASFVADRGDAAHRLDLAAARHLAGPFALSRAALQRLVAEGRVRVNGVAATRPAQRLAPGDLVELDVPPPAPRAAPAAEPLPLVILHEDAAILVLNKPAGVVAHPTPAHHSGTLVNGLLWHAARRPDEATGWQPRLVQRLDKDTSGLLVVAKSPEVHAALQDARAAFEKDYLAVVWGRPAPERGLLTDPLGRDPLDRRRVMVKDSGAAARTGYQLLDHSRGTARGLSLVRCALLTGRTHQLRVHLSAHGWPIVGDPVYGHPPRSRLADIAADRAARAFSRQALHAWRLTFTHPRSGRRLQFEAPLPGDLAALLTATGLGRGLTRAPAASASQKRP